MIDCHFHLRATDSSTPEKRAAYAEWVRSQGQPLGIEQFCAIPYFDPRRYGSQDRDGPKTLAECQSTNEMVAHYVDEYPDLFHGWARTDPRLGETGVQEFRRAVEDLGLIGLKHHFLDTPWKCTDQRFDPVWEAAVDMEVPALIHVLYRHEERHPAESYPADVRELARRFPNLQIVEAHISTDDPERRIKNSYREDNIYLDISGSSCPAGTVEAAVDAAGAERIIFGTDNSPIPAVGRLRDADITDAERERIAGNMGRLIEVGA